VRFPASADPNCRRAQPATSSFYAIGFYETASAIDSTGKQAVAELSGSASANDHQLAAIVGMTLPILVPMIRYVLAEWNVVVSAMLLPQHLR
jgi:hypothetical protein